MIKFEDYPATGTPIPKAMYYYMCKVNEKQQEPIALNAELANKLFNNEMAAFFEKYPDEINKPCLVNMFGVSNITEEDKKFYEKELKI